MSSSSALTTSKLSPRKIEKREMDTKYRVTLKEFSDILKDLGDRFNSLVYFNALLLSQQSKGLELQMTDANGELTTLTRKDVKAANLSFTHILMDLKNYLRVSKKKPRQPTLPSTFTGTYIPAYAGEALKYFFNKGDFGPVDPMSENGSSKLMDSLPFVKKGYLLRNTTTMLFYIYTNQNKLQSKEKGQFTKPDKLFKEAFAGSIPATYYVAKESGKQIKMLMERAILSEDEGGLDNVDSPMNTFQVIQSGFSGKKSDSNGNEKAEFNEKEFNVYYYQNIAAANYFSEKNLDDAIDLAEFKEDKAKLDHFNNVKDRLGNDDSVSYRKQMLQEHDIVKQTSLKWKELKKRAKEGLQKEEPVAETKQTHLAVEKQTTKSHVSPKPKRK